MCSVYLVDKFASNVTILYITPLVIRMRIFVWLLSLKKMMKGNTNVGVMIFGFSGIRIIG